MSLSPPFESRTVNCLLLAFKTVRLIPLRSLALAILAIGAMLAAFAPNVQADPLFGPIMAYDGFDDSPLGTMSFSYFHLIKMTDLPAGLPMTAPGATASTGVVIPPGFEVDSVDGANLGQSLFSGDGATGITFTFDKTVLGALPTAVGIAWTDGGRLIHFSGTDGNGNSMGQIDDNTCCDFYTGGDGNPANYRLFYAIDPLGISSIHISNDLGGIEVDHLQYGLLAPTAVPEPSTIAFTLFTAGVLLTRAARRRLRS